MSIEKMEGTFRFGFVKDSKILKYDFIDLRSESEFKKGTIPNSINIPVLNDNEFSQVGIDYKKNGKQSAIKLGHHLINGYRKENLIDEWIQTINKNQNIKIFCKRGGLRSSTAVRWLNEKNIQIDVLEGGYKSYRKSINDIHSNIDNYKGKWLIISGYTGSGKTDLIKTLNSSIDLEGLANHRGSTFGGNHNDQPVQQNFENKLTNEYLQLCHSKLILESESRNIGNVALPGKFYEKMQSSDIVFIDSTIDERVNNIFEEYVLKPQYQGISKKSLLEIYETALKKIRNRLGGDNYVLIKRELEMSFNDQQVDNKLWIKLLLEKYYDRLYEYKIDILRKNIIFSGDWSACQEYLKKY
ncbi:MAG: tRNA 2-selenouridine(34) synthase MnmH [Candidatus Neomarinimicrobiota bacterium]